MYMDPAVHLLQPIYHDQTTQAITIRVVSKGAYNESSEEVMPRHVTSRAGKVIHGYGGAGNGEGGCIFGGDSKYEG